jgi:hypothetical protein
MRLSENPVIIGTSIRLRNKLRRTWVRVPYNVLRPSGAYENTSLSSHHFIAKRYKCHCFAGTAHPAAGAGGYSGGGGLCCPRHKGFSASINMIASKNPGFTVGVPDFCG